MGSWRVPKTRHDHSSTEGPQDRAGGSYCASGGPGVESRTVNKFKDRTALVTEATLLLAVLFLGTNPVAVKVAVSEVPALPFVAMRFTLAGLLLVVIVLLVGLERTAVAFARTGAKVVIADIEDEGGRQTVQLV